MCLTGEEGGGTLPMFKYHSVLQILSLLLSQKDAENIAERIFHPDLIDQLQNLIKKQFQNLCAVQLIFSAV